MKTRTSCGVIKTRSGRWLSAVSVDQRRERRSIGFGSYLQRPELARHKTVTTKKGQSRKGWTTADPQRLFQGNDSSRASTANPRFGVTGSKGPQNREGALQADLPS